MSMTKFNLNDYTQAVLQIAKENSYTVEVAFQCFLANLSTMQEHFKGAVGINYHELGQCWNSLPNAEKLSQKTEMKARLARYNKGGNS